jgi:hypothetical protein
MAKEADIQRVPDMGRSHPDNLRWRCYYAAFDRRHGRPSDGHEFDPFVMDIVDAALSVVKNELAVFVDGR